MNTKMPMPTTPVTMIRLPNPIDATSPPHLVMILVVPEGASVILPGDRPHTVEDLDEEPTWEDAECL